MKKGILVLVLTLIVSLSLFANGAQEGSVAYPAGAVELVALGSAGGGSDAGAAAEGIHSRGDHGSPDSPGRGARGSPAAAAGHVRIAVSLRAEH